MYPMSMTLDELIEGLKNVAQIEDLYPLLREYEKAKVDPTLTRQLNERMVSDWVAHARVEVARQSGYAASFDWWRDRFVGKHGLTLRADGTYKAGAKTVEIGLTVGEVCSLSFKVSLRREPYHEQCEQREVRFPYAGLFEAFDTPRRMGAFLNRASVLMDSFDDGYP